MPNYRRAFIPGGCWFFTVNLLEHPGPNSFVPHIGVCRMNVSRVLTPTFISIPGGDMMPFVIDGNVDSNRIVITELMLELGEAFFFPIARGELLTPELLANKPDPYFVKPPRKGGIPEIFSVGNSFWIVKENVRTLVEGLEPGIHTFIPVNVRTRDSDKNWGQYYVLYPGQAVDAVVIDDTDFAEGRGRTGFAKSPTLSSFGDTVLDGAMIEGRHLWRGARGQLGRSTPFWAYLFCSDELAEQVEIARVEGWRFRRCKLK